MKSQTRSSNRGALRQHAKPGPQSAQTLPGIESITVQRQIVDANAMRHAQIAEAAYYRAEKRGFVAGCDLDDWLAAEQEVDEKSRRL